MHITLMVDFRNGIQHREKYRAQCFFRQALALFEHFGKLAAVLVVHDHVCGVVFMQYLMDANDIRMFEQSQRFCFAGEIFKPGLIVFRKLGLARHDQTIGSAVNDFPRQIFLDGDIHVEVLIDSEVGDGKTAASQHLLDLVAADSGTLL